ncbi:bifunctional transcriptional activator/DNA repair enzyme AdaA [Paenibacillus humicola]|uniref:bifunctional transcriptional activator/DNA repair enzyme AdaA n=1 Tax=Paenibacillus humicola TaxID=3110540 RepID=UPI00237BEAFC|nr:Ada metal-binding domain-containing protein [Paenibacillus humicola]
MNGTKPTDEQWQAVVRNDAAFDGTFYYAVKTTGVFCRPSCKSKPPLRANVIIFSDAEQALLARFRPCKRCRPSDPLSPDEAWTERIAGWIDSRYGEPLSLGALAELFHGSPFHLQRTFKRIKGTTPAVYMQRVRIERAKETLAASDKPVSAVAAEVGIPNAAHFATLFQKQTGMTPTAFRSACRTDRTQ